MGETLRHADQRPGSSGSWVNRQTHDLSRELSLMLTELRNVMVENLANMMLERFGRPAVAALVVTINEPTERHARADD